MPLVDVSVFTTDSGILNTDLACHNLTGNVKHNFRIILLVVFVIETTVICLDQLHRLGLIFALVLRLSKRFHILSVVGLVRDGMLLILNENLFCG